MPQALQDGKDAAMASNDDTEIADITEEATDQNSGTEDRVLPPNNDPDDWEHPPHLQGIAAVATDDSFIIEFNLMPEGIAVEETCRLGDSIVEVKAQIATRLHLQPEHIIMKIDNKQLEDSKLLEDYNPDHKPRLGVELSIDYRNQKEEPFQMPSTIQVNCDFGDRSKPMPVFVQLEKSVVRKPFLGGFRHRQTQLEFHNASSQTLSRRWLNEDGDQKDKTLRYHRETQTPNMKSRTQQTTRECGTQMERAGLYLSGDGERVVEARKYSDSNELLQLQIKMATRIQCFVRFTFARRRTRALLNHRNQQRKLDEDRQRQEMAKQDAEREKQIDRRIHPRTRDDFRSLLDEMDAWREHETNRIKTNMASNGEGERNAALQDLMDKELRLLQTIDKLRIEAAGKNRQCSAERRLARMAAPKTCILPSKGEKVAVETPQTIRARELMELYSGLEARELSMDERLDVLLHVKWTVKEFDGPLIRELVELIDREADLLNRGRSSNSLTGLRRRMTQLFYAFANTPDFNPAAEIFSNVITRA